MVGGIVGALLLGLFAEAAIGGVDGAFFGAAEQFLRQVISIVIAVVFSFVATYIIAIIIDRTMGLRVSEDEERRGLDITLHEEQGYVLTE